MPVILQAPYPALQTTTTLPNPEFGDGENKTDEVSVMRSITGGLYTYVKTKSGRRKLLMQFNLDRLKAFELDEFIRAYYVSKIRLTDVNGIVWIGNFTSNPFDFDSPNQRQSIQLEFEGVRE